MGATVCQLHIQRSIRHNGASYPPRAVIWRSYPAIAALLPSRALKPLPSYEGRVNQAPESGQHRLGPARGGVQRSGGRRSVCSRRRAAFLAAGSQHVGPQRRRAQGKARVGAAGGVGVGCGHLWRVRRERSALSCGAALHRRCCMQHAAPAAVMDALSSCLMAQHPPPPQHLAAAAPRLTSAL